MQSKYVCIDTPPGFWSILKAVMYVLITDLSTYRLMREVSTSIQQT